MTGGNDAMRNALLIAEKFIQQELENRLCGGESEYVDEARATLAIVQEALRI